jgi:hypothetical protein
VTVHRVKTRLRDDDLAQLAALAEHFGWSFTQVIKAALDRLADDLRAAQQEDH